MLIPGRRAKVCVAVPLVLNFVLVRCSAGGEKVAPDPMHVLQRLGTGHTVSATLKDGTSVKGKLVTIDDSSFGLDRGKKKGILTLSYADVASVQRDEITKGEKIAIGVAIPVAAVGVWVGIRALEFEHGNGNLCPADNPQCVSGLARSASH